MKLKYIKEYANFNKHPEDKKVVKKILDKEDKDKKVSDEEMKTALVQVAGFENRDLENIDPKPLFNGLVRDLEIDEVEEDREEEEEEEIDPDLRNKK
jgi:hypothetical protein